MVTLSLNPGQIVQLPAVLLSNGRGFRGRCRDTRGEELILESLPGESGELDARVPSQAMLIWTTGPGATQQSVPVRVSPRPPNQLVVVPITDERRGSPRMPADIEMSYELLAQHEVGHIADQVMARVNTWNEGGTETAKLLRSSDGDPLAMLREEMASMRELMGEMLKKIEELTAVVSGTKPAAPSGTLHPLAILNLSGTGMGFFAAEPLARGQYLLLRMKLPMTPSVTIDCLAVVARCISFEADDKRPARHEIGLRFTHLHENDRERLIQYLFKIQRRMLRDRREARDAMSARD